MSVSLVKELLTAAAQEVRHCCDCSFCGLHRILLIPLCKYVLGDLQAIRLCICLKFMGTHGFRVSGHQKWRVTSTETLAVICCLSSLGNIRSGQYNDCTRGGGGSGYFQELSLHKETVNDLWLTIWYKFIHRHKLKKKKTQTKTMERIIHL